LIKPSLSASSNVAACQQGRHRPHRQNLPLDMGAVVNRGVSDAFEGFEVFKRYQFAHIKLGVGTTCQVHEATDQRSDVVVAIKIIVKPEAALAGKSDADLHKEVEILRHLGKHPNVVHFVESFEDSELLYFVMELCQGGTLFEKLEQDIVLEENIAKKMCKEMFNAVHHLHDKGFIHRDLRPESWLMADLSEESALKLSNFGMVCECKEDQSLSQPCGTLHYVAPEVLRGSYGRASDVWTIGVLLFLILYGSYPFDGESATLVMRNILTGEPDWSDSCFALTAEVRDLLKGLLTKDVSKRLTIAVGLKHHWLPQAPVRRHSVLDSIADMFGKKRGSNRPSLIPGGSGSLTGSTGTRKIKERPSIPELASFHSKPGQARRPSALVTSDLLGKLNSQSPQDSKWAVDVVNQALNGGPKRTTLQP